MKLSPCVHLSSRCPRGGGFWQAAGFSGADRSDRSLKTQSEHNNPSNQGPQEPFPAVLWGGRGHSTGTSLLKDSDWFAKNACWVQSLLRGNSCAEELFLNLKFDNSRGAFSGQGCHCLPSDRNKTKESYTRRPESIQGHSRSPLVA